jgi:hypothetical protein
MRDFHIGDQVTFFGRAYYVRGLSPMSAPRRSIHLEDAQTGKQLEIAVDDPTGKVSPGHFFGVEDDAK